MRKALVIANWKMNPGDEEEAMRLARHMASFARRTAFRGLVIAPPFPFLKSVGGVLGNVIALGAQDASGEEKGPYTGEVSAGQLKDLGVRFVIVGHSERRMHWGESNALIGKKMRRVLEEGLTPVLCVGERDRQDGQMSLEVGTQLRAILTGLPRRMQEHYIIVYEPVWAVSTMQGSQPDTPENAFRAKLYIQKIIADLFGAKNAAAIKVIYGGSVRPENVRGFLREGRMDGVLIGGASLSAKVFLKILQGVYR
ncbi:MAG: triosephosphate isomerase (TIM) [Parcubacteria group bacterium Gr01-1014_66]|nr:MAG: triosephosphate isomerase (TIM) [Parcubacteria group bacterium Gr01-1014_66]